MISQPQRKYAVEQINHFDELASLDYVSALECDVSHCKIAYETIENFSKMLKNEFESGILLPHLESIKKVNNMIGLSKLDNKPTYSMEAFTFSNDKLKSLLATAQKSIVDNMGKEREDVDMIMLSSATESSSVILNSSISSVATESDTSVNKKKNIVKELKDIQATMESNINAIISIGDTIKSRVKYEETHPTPETAGKISAMMTDYVIESMYMYNIATDLMKFYGNRITSEINTIYNNPV